MESHMRPSHRSDACCLVIARALEDSQSSIYSSMQGNILPSGMQVAAIAGSRRGGVAVALILCDVAHRTAFPTDGWPLLRQCGLQEWTSGALPKVRHSTAHLLVQGVFLNFLQ